jgi:hypothetical protein
VGPPRFELESLRPERNSIDQANPRALELGIANSLLYLFQKRAIPGSPRQHWSTKVCTNQLKYYTKGRTNLVLRRIDNVYHGDGMKKAKKKTEQKNDNRRRLASLIIGYPMC